MGSCFSKKKTSAKKPAEMQPLLLSGKASGEEVPVDVNPQDSSSVRIQQIIAAQAQKIAAKEELVRILTVHLKEVSVCGRDSRGAAYLLVKETQNLQTLRSNKARIEGQVANLERLSKTIKLVTKTARAASINADIERLASRK